ncbi:MAG: hypothetical protein LBK66_13055 [Spirochaetaceae bacterium]|jgi:uncharacterized membrane protein YhhN|nr:hypothetical protein [Spirochaetaceae bacterium]
MNNLQNFIDDSHIYRTKPESWFKFLGLAVAWFGGFFCLEPSIDITQYSVAFFVYSIALFMECFLKLTSSSRLPGKIYPLIIVVCGAAILLDSVSQWRNQGMGFLPIIFLNICFYSGSYFICRYTCYYDDRKK